MSTVALVPQPPELTGAGGRRRAHRSDTTPADAPSTTRTLTDATTSRTTRSTGPRVSLTSATTGRVPARACAGVEVGWQPVADRAPLRLTRRGRAVVAAVTVLVFGAAILVVGLRAVGTLTDGPRFSETTSVQVGAGQTLWSIAVETNPGQDPRIVIDEIIEINGLRHAGDVVPGQTLVVPKP